MSPVRRDDDRSEPTTDEAALSARLRRLGERLGQHQSDRLSEDDHRRGASSDASGLARGFQLTAEFVAGILVGAAIGWLMDRWLGTKPWGMIVWLLLGFAAGILNLIRAAGVVAKNTLEPPDTKK